MDLVRILMLEDNEDDALLIQKSLTRDEMNIETTVVSTKQEFIDALNNNTFDIVLSDHTLPQFNSIEALKIVRKQNPFLPFIILTGAVREEYAISIFKEGADDYIMKDSLMRLPSAILKAIELKKYQQELSKGKKS